MEARMRADSPYYYHCFDLLVNSLLFSHPDGEMIRKMLLEFRLETWKKKYLASDVVLHDTLTRLARLILCHANHEYNHDGCRESPSVICSAPDAALSQARTP